MVAGAEVSGRAFLGLLGHIIESKGPEALATVVADAGPATESVFAHRIRAMAWYDYGAYTAFLRAADRRLGNGDTLYCRALGAVAGQRDLGTVFRVYAAVASPERLIRACRRLWSSYHRHAGRMEAVECSPEGTVLRIYDFPQMTPEHCRLMEGWMLSVMRQIGVKIPSFSESICMSRGGPYHQFQCVWTAA